MASDALRGDSSSTDDDVTEALKTCVASSPSKGLNNMCLAAWKSIIDKMKSDTTRKSGTVGTKAEGAKQSDEYDRL